MSFAMEAKARHALAKVALMSLARKTLAIQEQPDDDSLDKLAHPGKHFTPYSLAFADTQKASEKKPLFYQLRVIC